MPSRKIGLRHWHRVADTHWHRLCHGPFKQTCDAHVSGLRVKPAGIRRCHRWHRSIGRNSLGCGTTLVGLYRFLFFYLWEMGCVTCDTGLKALISLGFWCHRSSDQGCADLCQLCHVDEGQGNREVNDSFGAVILATRAPAYDQLRALPGVSFRATERFSPLRFHKAVAQSAASQPYC